MKTKFVIIFHHWWMDRGDWLEEIIEAESQEAAEQYASAKCHRRQHTFQNWDFHIVKAVTRVTTEPAPRALTWRERLTGRISALPTEQPQTKT